MARTLFRGGQGSGRSLLLLTIVFAVIAAVLVFLALNQDDEGDKASASDNVKVVVAKQDIAARTKLEANLLEIAEVPKESVLKGSFEETKALEGQITRYPLLKGEQVVSSKIGTGAGSSEDKEEGLSFVVPAGMRAFSIRVSEESSVGGLILPGDLVDVIGLLKESEVGIDKAVTLLQNVEVLAVAQAAQEPIPATTSTGTPTPSAVTGTLGERPEDVKPNPSARTVTLAVTPEQAQLLALVQAQGDLALSLRSFGDRGTSVLPESDLVPYGAVRKTPSP